MSGTTPTLSLGSVTWVQSISKSFYPVSCCDCSFWVLFVFLSHIVNLEKLQLKYKNVSLAFLLLDVRPSPYTVCMWGRFSTTQLYPQPTDMVRTVIRIKRSEKVKISWVRTSEEGKQGGQCWLPPQSTPPLPPLPPFKEHKQGVVCLHKFLLPMLPIIQCGWAACKKEWLVTFSSQLVLEDQSWARSWRWGNSYILVTVVRVNYLLAIEEKDPDELQADTVNVRTEGTVWLMASRLDSL